MSDLYRDRGIIPEYNFNVPTSGLISFSNLAGASIPLASDVASIYGNATFDSNSFEFALTTSNSGNVGCALLSDTTDRCEQCFSVSFDVKVANPAATPGNSFWITLGATSFTDSTISTGNGVKIGITDDPTANTYAIYHDTTLISSRSLGFTHSDNTWRPMYVYVDFSRRYYRCIYGSSFHASNFVSAITLLSSNITISASTGTQSNQYTIRNVCLNKGPIFDDQLRTFPRTTMTYLYSTIVDDAGLSAVYSTNCNVTSVLSNNQVNFGPWRAFDGQNTTYHRSAIGSYNTTTGDCVTTCNSFVMAMPIRPIITKANMLSDGIAGIPLRWTLAGANITTGPYTIIDNVNTTLWNGTLSRDLWLKNPLTPYRLYQFCVYSVQPGGTEGTYSIPTIELQGYDYARGTTSNIYSLGSYAMSPYNQTTFSNKEARWINTRSDALTSSSQGVTWIGKSINTLSNYVVRLHIVADKTAKVYVNDSYIFETSSTSNTYQSQTFVLPQGSNHFLFQLSNFNGGTSSGLLMALEKPSVPRIMNIQAKFNNNWILKSDTSFESFADLTSNLFFVPPSMNSNNFVYDNSNWSVQTSSVLSNTSDSNTGYRVFDYSPVTFWSSSNATYETVSFNTLSNTSNLFTPNDNYAGDWVCLTMPYPVRVTGYEMIGYPDAWRLYASTLSNNSNFGSSSASASWFVLDDRNDIGNSAGYSNMRSFTVSSTSNIYRLALRVRKLRSDVPVGTNKCYINHLKFYATRIITTLSNFEISYRTPGIYTYTIPSSVTSISGVCVGAGGGGGCGCNLARTAYGAGGGGALAYSNNITVTNGDVLTVGVGTGGLGAVRANNVFVGGDGTDSYIKLNGNYVVLAKGGLGGVFKAGGDGGNFALCIGQGGGSGGSASGNSNGGNGGGGAGGYSGDGGTTRNVPTATSGTGGGGAAGVYSGGGGGGGGGGVNLFGETSSGIATATVGAGGAAGSGGTNGVSGTSSNSSINNASTGGNGGDCGGGGGSSDDFGTNPTRGGNGGNGGVRIVFNHTQYTLY